MVEKSAKTVVAKKRKTSEKDEKIVKKLNTRKKKIDGTKAAYVNAICLSCSLIFGVMAICFGISDLTGWLFDGSFFMMIFKDSALASGIISVVCAILSFSVINRITDKKAFEKIWKILYKIFLGLGVFELINVVSVVIYSIVTISPESGINHGDLWLNDFLPNFIMLAAYFGLVLIAKKILEGKTVLVRIFGIVSIVLSVIGFLTVMTGLFYDVYGEKSEQNNYLDSDNSSEYDGEIDMEDLYNTFMNPFGF